MPYEILEHTADLRMRVAGKTKEDFFSAALEGMMRVLAEKPPKFFEKKLRQVKIESPDLTSLLIDFLNEALSLAYINKEIYIKAVFKKLSETILEAELEGAAIDGFDEDIKAATYHEASAAQNEKGEWETVIIFDI
ncbi:MAG: archease [Parcubacteria group bacterium]|nr:archease [Parcubacteria group bacterium]